MFSYIYKGVPEFVRITIATEIKYLLNTKVFNAYEKEDLIQELLLFYFQRFKDTQKSEAYIVTCIRNQAKDMLSNRFIKKHRYGPENQFNRADDNFDLEMYSDQYKSDIDAVEAKYIAEKILSECKGEAERKILLLLLEGASINEIVAFQHISKNTIKKILEKIKKNYVF